MLSQLQKGGLNLRPLLTGLILSVLGGGLILASQRLGAGLQKQVEPVLQVYSGRPRLQGKAAVEMIVQTAQAGLITLTLELDGEAAPLTAGNFADLVQRGFYNGLIFYQVEKDPEPFVVRGGDPNGNGTGGYQDPVSQQLRRIPLEIKLKGQEQPLYNTPVDVAASVEELVLDHRRGAVGMARSANEFDSASSQFYISLASLPILDGRFAVFGYVVEGMDGVDQIQVGDVIQSVKILEGSEHLVYEE